MSQKKLLICGSTGFIGRNLLEAFKAAQDYQVYATYRSKPPETCSDAGRVIFLKADLTDPSDVEAAVKGKDMVIQAAATTSGAKDIVTKPHYHVTDNAVMNSLIFRACYEHKVDRVVFFSCTTMYGTGLAPVREEDFDGRITDKYFGVGWTKVYLEKMCEFYSRIGSGKYTVIRHSNIYGPYDKFDLERSHVFGATVAKVMNAQDGKIVVWGDGTDERDLLHVDDLMDFVRLILTAQTESFELVNLGLGRSVSVRELVDTILRHSGRNLEVVYDASKPNIGFKLALDIRRVRERYGWCPKITLEEGIRKTLDWYREHYSAALGEA